MSDLRYAARTLLRSPGFTAVAALTLALGMGANTAIFSVVYATLLHPLPYREPGRLVQIWETNPREIQSRLGASPADFTDWSREGELFEHVAALNLVNTSFNLTGRDEPERLEGVRVSSNLFALLGVDPILGRTFRPDDERTVLLSHGLWERRFGADRRIIGQGITLNQQPYTIIGVLPKRFRFFDRRFELWTTPILSPQDMEQRGWRFLRVFARLQPGVTVEQAQARMDALMLRLAQQHQTNQDYGALVAPLHEQIVSDVRPALRLIFTAVGVVLLIACANVANLLLARATGREKEMSIRSALGATRGRLVRQLFTESLLLAGLGAAAGLVLALWGVELLSRLIPRNLLDAIPVEELGVNGPVLAFTLGISFLAALLFGLAPAFLRAGAPGRGRGLLVVAEMALSLVLLIGGGLLFQSFWRLLRVDPGFRSEGVLTLRIHHTARAVEFFQQALERIRALPGVESAAATAVLPGIGARWAMTILVEGQSQYPVVLYRPITPNYFRTMGVPLLRGRDFTPQDSPASPPVALVNESMARRLWPNEDAIGKRLRPGDAQGAWATVVGVVGDERLLGLESEARPTLYRPFQQHPSPAMSLIIKTAGDPAGLAPLVRNAIRAVDPDQPVFLVETLEQVLGSTLAGRRFYMILLGVFAALAASLSVVGLYSVLAYSVSRRTREFGIRLALGAKPVDVVLLVVSQGLVLTAAGAAIGLGLAAVLTRYLASLLYGVRPTDAWTFFGVAGLLLAVGLAASWLPSRRAARLNPMEALRHE
jgi:putative ABC transport system permease protein